MHPRHLATLFIGLTALAATDPKASQEVKLIEREGRVVVTKAGARPAPAVPGMGLAARDKLGTGEASRAVLRMSERWLARIDEETDVEITASAIGAKDHESLKVALGGAFIFSREEEGDLKVHTPTATGGLRGTQLMVRVARDGTTWMQVVEGEVDLGNENGQLRLRAGEAGEVAPGQAPRRTAVIETRNLLQWALYYPAVVAPEEFNLGDSENPRVAPAFAAYQAGALPEALELLPRPVGDEAAPLRFFRAAVLLAAGRVAAARTQLQELPPAHSGRRALERLIAAVTGSEATGDNPLSTASLALAESYYQQSRHNLPAARAAAQRAAALAPAGGFALVRLAELEFSFGRTRAASAALDRALTHVPRHAQAHSLRGFLLSADHRIAEARAAFELALSLDGGLGQAWLGLGLKKIKQGDLSAGRADLQTAAVVEPTRSFFYSYHAKALGESSWPALARKDLLLARQLDPADPTPRLYSALQDQSENRYNSAIAEMLESIRLNDNRRLYRSQFLLDEDRAVRSANQARLFQQNGMPDTAVREAARAVESDYTNASAHQFLADSFDHLRDPDRNSLRFETAWFNEQLLAALLSPVGGGPLSQFVSQQEFSGMFERDRRGGSVISEWRSDGRIDSQASLFSTSGRTSLGFDLAHFRNRGSRPDNATERVEAYAQAKVQVSASDLLYGLAQWQERTGGDLAENYAHTSGNPGLHFEDRLAPGLLLVGWNRRWSPGVNTLFLGGRLAADQTVQVPSTRQTLLGRDPAALQPGFLLRDSTGALSYASAGLRSIQPAPVTRVPGGALAFSSEFQREIAPYLGRAPVTATYNAEPFAYFRESELVFHTAELQQIWKTGRHTLLAGARWQAGDIATASQLTLLNPALQPFFAVPAAAQQVTADFERRSAYLYGFSDVTRWLRLLAGAAWDHVERPVNFRNPPITGGETTARRANAKVGFTLAPAPSTTVRGVYAEALGGVTFDESVRLEPVQLAGFDQTFRTVISESVAGSVESPVYKLWGLGADGHLAGRTWWHATTQVLRENVDRTVGVFDAYTAAVFPTGAVILPSATPEVLRYRETDTTVGLTHLIGNELAAGVNYRRTHATLRRRFPQVPTPLDPQGDREDTAKLHRVQLHAVWNAPTGWFARADATWRSQSLAESMAGRPVPAPLGDEFWHFDLRLGVRLRRNQIEFSTGVLNLTDRNYRLSPLTQVLTLPRARTAVMRLRGGF